MALGPPQWLYQHSHTYGFVLPWGNSSPGFNTDSQDYLPASQPAFSKYHRKFRKTVLEYLDRTNILGL